jgi:uncharacterized protein
LERFNKILSHGEFQYRLTQIERFEEHRTFCRHGYQHLVDTARVAYILVLENGLDIPKDIVYATALLHDIGRFDEYTKQIAHAKVTTSTITILRECGYTGSEVVQIVEAIENHQKEPTEVKTLSDVLYQADKLSRMCFNCQAIDECYWSTDRKNRELQL